MNDESDSSLTPPVTTDTVAAEPSAKAAETKTSPDASANKYLKKYLTLQTKYGENGVTVEIGQLFFKKLMAREHSHSGVQPDLDDIFNTLRITEELKQETGVTNDDWLAIITAMKIEKKFIAHAFEGFQNLDPEANGLLTLGQAAELFVAGGPPLEEGDEVNATALLYQFPATPEKARAKAKAQAIECEVDTLTFENWYNMVLVDRDAQRRRQLARERKDQIKEDATALGKSIDNGIGMMTSGGNIVRVEQEEGSEKFRFRRQLKKAVHLVELENTVWNTPSRAVSDRKRLEKEKTEKELMIKKKKQEDSRFNATLAAKQKAEKAAVYKRIADDQARRLENMEAVRLERLEETNRRIAEQSRVVIVKKNKKSMVQPNAPATKSPDNKSTLFRSRKRVPMSDSDLSSMMLSASVSVFPEATVKNRLIPIAITTTGCPHKIPKFVKTDAVDGRSRYW